jgi:hypothetical protein
MTLAEYFAENRPKPKFFLGDRVHGKYQGIMFRGSVGNDRMTDEEEGSVVTVHLDLPLRIDDTVLHILVMKQKDLSLSK